MADVNIRVNALDEGATDTLEDVGDGIDDLGARAANAGKGGFEQLATSADKVTRAIERGYGVMTRLDLTHISLQQSTERVRVAHEKYQAALAQGGPASAAALRANRELESAQTELEKTQLRARLSYVLVAGDLVSMAAQAPRVAAGLRGVGVAAVAAARGLTTMQIAGGAATAALAGLAAAAALLGEEGEKGKTAVEELALAEENLAEKQSNARLWGGSILTGVQKVMGVVPLVTTDLEALEEAEKRVADARDAVATERWTESIIAQGDAAIAAATATAKLEATNQSLAGATRTAFQSMGVDLSNFSQATQEALLVAAGVSEEFAASLRPVVTAEQMLAAASPETRKQLLDQMGVMAKKGQTTEELARELGLTTAEEEELKKEGRWTTEGIITQDEAMRRAAQSAREMATAYDSVDPFLAKLQNGSNPLGGNVVGVTSSSREVNSFRANGGRFGAGLAAADEEFQQYIHRSPEALNDPAVAAYRASLTANLDRPHRFNHGGGASRRQSKLAGLRDVALPFLAAADGFHGDIASPTLMLVGEEGKERVDVTPDGKRGGGMTNHITINVPTEASARQVDRTLARTLGSLSARRFAGQRSF